MAEKTTVVKLDVPEKIPISFDLGDRAVDGAIIKSLSLVAFVDCVMATREMTAPKSFEAKLRRQRLIRQVVFYAGAVAIPVSSDEILRMPIPVARTLIEK